MTALTREPAVRRAAPARDTRRLTVAINAQINPANPGGVETALQGLIAHLASRDDDARYLLLATARYAPALATLAGPTQQVVPWPFPQKAYAPFRTMTRRWQRLKVRAGPLGPGVDAAHLVWWATRRALTHSPTARQSDAALRQQAATLVHFPYPIRFGTDLPYVYEPWDLQHRHYPAFFTSGEWRWRDQMYREGCEGARLVVTATRWTKRDIVEQYGIDPARIAVVPRGPLARPVSPSPADVDRIRARLQLPERFGLYPAMTFPHKNHLRLLEALARLRDRDGVVLPLVCTGRPYEPHAPAIEAAIARLGLDGQVRQLGPVDTETLSALFATAWALVFPSLFEGLGLPVLEALEHGLPVIASNATCLPEVAGDAALLFDATRVDAIADALLEAWRRPELLDACRAHAPGVLERFSWARAAATFAACYRFAAGQPLTEEQTALLAAALAD